MALGATIKALIQGSSATGAFRVNGWATSEWQAVVDAGGVNTVDNATIILPTTQIVNSTTHVFSCPPGAGTYLRLRMKYDDGITAVTSPVIRVFGRYICSSDSATPGIAGPWQHLKNVNGDLTATLTVDLTNDVQDGTYSYTIPSTTLHSWDKDGCSEFLVGIQTALSATGTVNTATIEAKFV